MQMYQDWENPQSKSVVWGGGGEACGPVFWREVHREVLPSC